MFRAITHENVRCPFNKIKMCKTALENKAEIAATVFNTALDARTVVPLDPDKVDKEYVEKWVVGDPKVVLEVECFILSKDPSASVRDIPTLKELMDAHAGGCSVQIIKAQQNLKSRAAQLESCEFDLKFGHVQFDREAFKVYMANLESFEMRQC